MISFCLQEILQNGRKIQPIQLQIIECSYNKKSNYLKVQLSDSVYKTQSISLKTKYSEFNQLYAIIEISNYDLMPIKNLKPDMSEK